jgi:hypothetical protein
MWVIPAVVYNMWYDLDKNATRDATVTSGKTRFPRPGWTPKKRSGESGQILALTAGAMFLMIASVGFAAELGVLWTQSRHMQTAADAAAAGAASALRDGKSITSSADNVASVNGFANGVNNTTVTVQNPPSSGEYAGKSGYVEVILQQREPVFFLRMLGYNSFNIGVTAVSGWSTLPLASKLSTHHRRWSD